jgi:hypothetical protein
VRCGRVGWNRRCIGDACTEFAALAGRGLRFSNAQGRHARRGGSSRGATTTGAGSPPSRAMTPGPRAIAFALSAAPSATPPWWMLTVPVGLSTGAARRRDATPVRRRVRGTSERAARFWRRQLEIRRQRARFRRHRSGPRCHPPSRMAPAPRFGLPAYPKFEMSVGARAHPTWRRP